MIHKINSKIIQNLTLTLNKLSFFLLKISKMTPNYTFNLPKSYSFPIGRMSRSNPSERMSHSNPKRTKESLQI